MAEKACAVGETPWAGVQGQRGGRGGTLQAPWRERRGLQSAYGSHRLLPLCSCKQDANPPCHLTPAAPRAPDDSDTDKVHSKHSRDREPPDQVVPPQKVFSGRGGAPRRVGGREELVTELGREGHVTRHSRGDRPGRRQGQRAGARTGQGALTQFSSGLDV